MLIELKNVTFFRFLVTIVSLMVSHGANSKVLPIELMGDWEVSEVHINMASGRTVSYDWNDPRLRWRIFNFKYNKIANNTPDKVVNCAAPTFIGERVRLDDFLKANFKYGNGEPVSPSKDYELGVAGNTKVEVMRVLCGQETWNGDNSWLIRVGKNRVMLPWFDQTILVLTKIAPGVKPAPSFACAKATLPTERTICGSLELAGFDKSVDFAYRLALQSLRRFSESTVDVQRKQCDWLNERNRCGSDAQCIQVEMEKQLEWYAKRTSY